MPARSGTKLLLAALGATMAALLPAGLAARLQTKVMALPSGSLEPALLSATALPTLTVDGVAPATATGARLGVVAVTSAVAGTLARLASLTMSCAT